MDRDLLSIQQVRDLVKSAKIAQKLYSTFTQEQIDRVVYAIVQEMKNHYVDLAKKANEETGFGKWEDKVIKNKFANEFVYDYIKDMKTVGILNETDTVTEVGVPMGIVAALTPSTNPTSTAIYKTLISLKAGNAVIVSPHPNAKNCVIDTVKLMQKAAVAAGAPEGLIGVIEIPTIEGTNELMKSKDTSIILATGGEAMVRAAYSSGRPAIGVGPGNGPAYIEKSANVKEAVRKIIESKTFDKGVICASEQSVIVEPWNKEAVMDEFRRQGGFFLSKEESEKLGRFILRPNGTMNPQIVGKDAQTLAKLAGLNIPSNVKVLLSEQNTVSKSNPYSREKLTTILAFYVEENAEKACERAIELLENEGEGHTLIIHSENKDIIREFALRKPVSRMLVNVGGSLGGVGATTNLAPAFTLGCGAVGGSSTSDNITPMNLINIRRVAIGVRELSDFKKDVNTNSNSDITNSEVEDMIRRIIAEYRK